MVLYGVRGVTVLCRIPLDPPHILSLQSANAVETRCYELSIGYFVSLLLCTAALFR